MCFISALTPEMEKKMEKIIGMRIRECRLALGMTQEEMSDVLQGIQNEQLKVLAGVKL